MRTQYDFETDLATLRLLLAREHQFSQDHRYRMVDYDNIRSLVITLESWLRNNEHVTSKDERREIRLDILSFITEEKIESSYDLTVYQSTCINHFLWFGPDDDEINAQENFTVLGERARQFLEDCQDRIEITGFSRERETAPQLNCDPTPIGFLTDLPDM